MTRSSQQIAAGMRQVAENCIAQAEREGELDNLPSARRPITGIDEPYDPDWWLKNWLRDHQKKGDR
jgi:hypothetical protein